MEIALRKRISDVIEEYNLKKSAIPDTIKEFEQAGTRLKAMSCVSGTWGNAHIDTGSIYEHNIAAHLLTSAWKNIYDGLQIDRLASAKDKSRFEQSLNNPPEFTIENIRSTFGDYIADPWGSILRGLAEAFADLDPVFKSHEKMKIGVKGLPKRVIIRGCGEYSSYGQDTIKAILNALAAYQSKPLVTYAEVRAIWKDADALLKPWKDGDTEYPARGVRLVRFNNGNGHLFFEPDTLRDVNKALSEYYGEVLADCSDENPQSNFFNTAVAKDLQFYPTPQKVVDKLLYDCYIRQGERVLEPSCGDGIFLDAISKAGGKVFGIEIDLERAKICRKKGHLVLQANFLELTPEPVYDWVIMNPPFYGKHYAKHVEHALKFLKKDGCLKAILPATARYDHGLLKGQWSDLPVGSFSESGTNINTTILTIWNR